MDNNGTTSIDSLPMSSQSPNAQPLQQSQQQSPPQMQPQQQQQQQMQPQQQQQQQQMQPHQQQQMQPQQQQQQQMQTSTKFDQSGVKELMSGLKSAEGMTKLSIRDVPQNQEQHVMDKRSQPNYIPTQENVNEKDQGDQDYIFNHQTSEDIIQENARKQQKTDSLDTLYNELQIPILISVLYFIFQLPIFHKTLFRYLPSLFNSDGNHSLAGFIFNSAIFGGIYYLMTKSIQNLGI